MRTWTIPRGTARRLRTHILLCRLSFCRIKLEAMAAADSQAANKLSISCTKDKDVSAFLWHRLTSCTIFNMLVSKLFKARAALAAAALAHFSHALYTVSLLTALIAVIDIVRAFAASIFHFGFHFEVALCRVASHHNYTCSLPLHQL